MRVAEIRLIFGWFDIGKCNCSIGALDNCSSNTAISLAVGPSGKEAGSRSARYRIISRTTGVMATVQHLSGMAAVPGSINKKKMRAFPVARQLWEIPPGIQTACCGGTSQDI